MKNRENDMKKFIVLASVSIGLLTGNASADALKNSLTNIMNTNDSTQMVDLGNFNLDAKPKRVKKVPKSRPANAVIGTINKHKIIKKDANAYLSQRTRGKITNYDAIPPKQQKMLLQEMGLPFLAYDAAKKELTALEQETVLTRAWMQKESRNIEIKDEEVRVVYDQLKQQSIDTNSTKPIPAFDAIKDRLRMQMIEKKMMFKLMKDVQITVAQ